MTEKRNLEQETISADKSPELREVIKALIRGHKFTAALLEKVLRGESI